MAVLSGGDPAESLASEGSAADIYSTLAKMDLAVLWLDLSNDRRWVLRAANRPVSVTTATPTGRSQDWRDALAAIAAEAKIDVVFPALHGHIGEDGQIQGLCSQLTLPYVGCDARSSLSCYDKVAFKEIVSPAGLPVAKHLAVGRRDYRDDLDSVALSVAETISYPCIVKPSCAGSSHGLARVKSPAELAGAMSTALKIHEVALVEQLFKGADVEIGVLQTVDTVVGRPVEIEYEGDLYDLAAKYDRPSRFHIPARLSDRLSASLMDQAEKAFHLAGCHGMARVDFLVDPRTETFILNEVNTIPYMTARSSFFRSLAATSGLTYPSLLEALLDDALAESG